LSSIGLRNQQAPNGVRYPLVGGTRQRRFDGTGFEPKKLPENAATPTSRVHAVLGAVSLASVHPGIQTLYHEDIFVSTSSKTS